MHGRSTGLSFKSHGVVKMAHTKNKRDMAEIVSFLRH